jgi:hypothetical protein
MVFLTVSSFTVYAAASQSCHIVGSTGVPSTHLKPASRNDLHLRRAQPMPDGFQEDTHCIVSLGQGDCVGGLHHGRISHPDHSLCLSATLSG